MGATPEQIAKWKELHGELIALKMNDDKFVIYLKQPQKLSAYFGTMSRAIALQQQEQSVEAGELILRSCYLGGDFGENLKDYNKETKEYLSACYHCSELVRVLTGNFQTT